MKSTLFVLWAMICAVGVFGSDMWWVSVSWGIAALVPMAFTNS
jgi:hypothetical protein